MPGAARLGDIGSEHDCFPPTPIIAGSGDVFIDGKPAVRQGDASHWVKYALKSSSTNHRLLSHYALRLF
ncbi:putative PAAR repeat-containing protein [Vibrio cholerae]|nr:putative PAAR repeat-containing protein [Vibrio cholerae]